MDMAKKKSIFWGTGKIEFAALLPEITELVNGEYPKTRIYAIFIGKNKMTMSYRRFCELVCQHFPERYGKPKKYSSPIQDEKGSSEVKNEQLSIDKENNKQLLPEVKKVNVVEIKEQSEFGKSVSNDDLKKLMGG